MKKTIFLLLFIWLLVSCGKETTTIHISNTCDFDRTNETVEIAWNDILAKIPEATPENIMVISPCGSQQPSQVIYLGNSTPLNLIFQVTVPAQSTAAYKLTNGVREEYPQLVYGRFVPERKDDFAWENNRVAFRMYGPALEATGEISNGIDVWVKSTEELIIDKWYGTPGLNYHRDNGEGLDCYKVGRTLGAGAMAPYEDDVLWLGNNFTNYSVMDSGPVRVTFMLNYAPFKVGDKTISETRVISFDAHTHFNRITEIYEGKFDELTVAAGIVMRSGEETVISIDGEPVQAVGYWEPQNTDNNEDNGHTAVGLVFQEKINIVEEHGHLLGVCKTKPGRPLNYFMGAGWSKGWVASPKAWAKELEQQVQKCNTPLRVEID